MLARFIPTWLHGVLDYLTGMLFLGLPRLSSWSQEASWLLSILGVSVWGYSLFTRYELGIVRAIPVPVHLVLDVLGGLMLMVAAFFWFNAESSVILWFFLLGLFEIGAGLLSDTTPFKPVPAQRSRATPTYDPDVRS
jgi:hypothetical protein